MVWPFAYLNGNTRNRRSEAKKKITVVKTQPQARHEKRCEKKRVLRKLEFGFYLHGNCFVFNGLGLENCSVAVPHLPARPMPL